MVNEVSHRLQILYAVCVKPTWTDREPMRFRTLKVLAVLLAAAVAVQPLQAYTCDMEQNQDQLQHGDHSMMQMSHADDSDADCCDPKDANTRDDCDRTMSCGTCLSGTSIVSALIQAASAAVQATTLDICAGKLLPSHTNPPYHPPIS